MANRTHHTTQRVVLAICALLLAACSYDKSSFQTQQQTQGQTEGQIPGQPSEDGAGVSPANLQMIGKVPVDEFNDQASGKDVPAKGGQIIVRFNAEPDTLTDWLPTGDDYAQIISDYIQDSMLRQNLETFEYEPSLAERWEQEDLVVKKDGAKLRGILTQDTPASVTIKTLAGAQTIPREQVDRALRSASFTFHLRKDARFHDGQPLTAEDVKFSYETIRNPDVDAPDLRNYFLDVESCEILDKYTVRFTLSKQYWMARSILGVDLEIMPRHVFDPDGLSEKDPKAFAKQINQSPLHRRPVGSGPYKFVRWDTGSQIVLERNDDYWDVERRGHLDRLIFRFISDPVPALQALKSGEIHVIPSRLNPEQYDVEMSDPAFLSRFAKIEYYVGSFRYIGWNMRRPPFNDVRVRQAMAHGAIDLPAFRANILHYHGLQVTGSQYYFGPAYNHDIKPLPYDPVKARQLLLEAGWYDRDGDGLRDKAGQAFRFEFLYPSGNDIYRRRAALMKENLRKLGIDMSARELEWATFIQTVTDRKFDSYTMGWGTPIESDPYQIWHTSQSENKGSNYPGFGNAETDRLIADSRLAVDDDERRRIFFEFHRVQYEMQPYLFLEVPPELGAYDKRYRGVKLYKSRPGYDFAEWYLPQSDGAAKIAENRPRGLAR